MKNDDDKNFMDRLSINNYYRLACIVYIYWW